MTSISHKRFAAVCKSVLICILGGVMMFGLFGCNEKKENTSDATEVKYKVDYSGQKGSYENAEDEYAAGEEVELIYGMIATDTDYSFTLNGGPLNYDYDDEKGIIVRFTMPAENVTLKCNTKNSMIYEPPTVQEDVLLLDSYRSIGATADGEGDGYDEISLYSYDNDHVKMCVYHQQGDQDEIQTDYLVPYEVVDKCYEIIGQYKLREWKKLSDAESLDGTLLVLKYKDGDEYIRVTSEKMPKDGEKAFNEIEGVLKSYIKEEYQVS